MKKLLSLVASLLTVATGGQAATYWSVDTLAESITYRPAEAGPHSDHLEMAGKRIASVLRYGVNAAGSFSIDKSLVWPTFRTIPNNTHGSLMRRSVTDIAAQIYINGQPVREQVESVTFDGVLTACSRVFDGVYLTRRYLTSTEAPALVERFTLVNRGNDAVDVEIPALRQEFSTPAARGVDGSYTIVK